MNLFFDNKRVIDFACGNKFSIVIAETFDLTKDEEQLYFKSLKSKLSEVGKKQKEVKKMVSTKMDIFNPRKSICDMGLNESNQSAKVPNDLRIRI